MAQGLPADDLGPGRIPGATLHDGSRADMRNRVNEWLMNLVDEWLASDSLLMNSDGAQ